MSKTLLNLSILISSSLFISACVSNVSVNGPGKTYGETPPQLKIQALLDKDGKATKQLFWDHPEYFGPVPADKQQSGDETCKAGGAKKATGFHPDAKGTDGISFPEGGYYCSN